MTGRRHFYGFSAVAFGGWEALALLGLLPTISTTVAAARTRWPRLTMGIVCGWSTGLVWHLARHESVH